MSEPQQSPAPRVKVFLESRYRKLERGLPQTVFYCPKCKGNRRRSRKCDRCGGFGKLTKDSVQELIARQILPAFKARLGKFHGAGREDLDVLMLGSGRPFIYEVVGPKNLDVDLVELDARIRSTCAGRVELAPLERVERARIVFWKEGHFDKVYRVVVETEGEVSIAEIERLVGQTLAITQRTPTRVAHRRADLMRERQVTIQTLTPPGAESNPRSFVLELRCIHGTYVKEWISGDAGRTLRSLTEILGVPCVCTQLDVLEVLAAAAS